MAGHSHWARIKHKKAVVDKRRGKLWSKLARHIIMAAKSGGGNPSENLSLRYAIDRARAANMPNDTIDRAIKRGTGDMEGVTYQEIVYEGYAPGGVAVMVEALTDNVNRTAPEIRNIFEKNGGNLGSTNCVAWQFKKKGVIIVSDVSEEELMEAALEAGAEDVQPDGDVFEVLTDPSSFEPVREALTARKLNIQNAELSMISDVRVPLEAEAADRVMKMIDALEDNDDVQEVHTNMEVK
ncbi:MAG: YebC/PmpR family DNA-binding transcriptional regulator [Phycisphaerae bacterium]|nr:YebC/PmpR family DNA-binding transcriptional regulator [Phycisphaerae bacterium]NUQ46929.1 YebC/PmpR family DNA-binding transcriptional regulator [Phycisphaerae bacterium]